MDVTCSRCQSVYEFEDTLVSTRGVVVRCTQCGHLFKIFPPGAAPGLPEESGWMLRREDGTVFAIDRFSTLQKWIGQGKVTRRDELSRTGESWKRIGEIVELAPFFDRVESAGVTQRSDTSPSIPVPPDATDEPTAPDEPPARPAPSIPATPGRRGEPAAAPKEADEGFDASQTVRQTTFELSESRRVSAGVDEPVPAASEAVDEPELLARPTLRPPRRQAAPRGELRYSTAEMELARPSRAWLWWTIVAVILVGATIAGVIFRSQLSRIGRRIFGGEESAETASEHRMEKADSLVAAETAESLRQAESEYAKVLEFNSADERALGGLLEVHALQAQFARDEIDVSNVLGLADRDPAEAARLRRDFDNEASRARELALALRNSGKPMNALPTEALRGLAEMARLQGDRTAARRLTDQALAADPGDPRTHYVTAMIAYDEALLSADPAAQAPAVEAAFARVTAPDTTGSGLARARLHLALFLAFAGRAPEARDQVRCVIDGGDACPGGRGEPHPDHLMARKLEAWLPLLGSGPGGPVALAVPAVGGAPIVPPITDADAGAVLDALEPNADAGTMPDALEPDAGAAEGGVEPDGGADADAAPDALEPDAGAAEIEPDKDATDTQKEAEPEMPSSVDGLLDAARAALENGSTQRAISLLQRASQLAPGDSEVQVNLGYAYMDAGRPAEARRAFERAGSHPDALIGLGDILLSQGSLESALQRYEQALSSARTPYQRRIAERKVNDLRARLGARTPPAQDAGTSPPPPPPPPPPTTVVPISDEPAVDSEPPGLPPVTEP